MAKQRYAPRMTAFESLADAQYVNLETFRKNGTGVQTPVWAAPNGDELVIFTNGNSYKVKRLRRNTSVRIAKCGGLLPALRLTRFAKARGVDVQIGSAPGFAGGQSNHGHDRNP